MTSNYDEIREKNARLAVEASSLFKLLSEYLYAGRAHFIFELLQNAEDANANGILFNLSQKVLEVQHNGKLFDLSDVLGICGAADSKKSDDNSTIGKFGIGFKSVFTYTDQPEVHSGDEHFVIKDFVLPEAIDSITMDEEWTTLFRFPLGTNEINAEAAYNDIKSGLLNLNPRTLLFLKNIVCIEIRFHGEVINTLQCEISTHTLERRVTITDAKSSEREDWLVYHREVPIPMSKIKKFVEVAFRVSIGADEKILDVITAENSELFVYFPTKEETHLGLLLQGPYVTNTSRESIKIGNEWNCKLIQKTADLLVFALSDLKEKGLLTVSALNTLPIQTEYFQESDVFFPLANAVTNAFRESELLPTSDGSHASAGKVKLGRSSDLIKLFSPKQLGEICNTNDDIYWLSEEISPNQTQTIYLYKYLTEELGIEVIRSEIFVRKLDEKFLVKQSDEWICRLYAFASGQQYITDALCTRPIIRLQDNSHVIPIKENGDPNVFLPSEDQTETDFQIVKSEICENEEAKKFLEKLGILEVELIDNVLENILPKYHEQRNILVETNLSDFKSILKAFLSKSMEKKKRLIDRLSKTPFILIEGCSDENPTYSMPNALYIANDKHKLYFSGNTSIKFVSSKYNFDSDIQNLLDNYFWSEIGVNDKVRVFKRVANYDGNVYISRQPYSHIRGLNYFDPKTQVEGLEFALANITREKSEFIWNEIVIPNKSQIYGKVESCPRQTYEGSETVAKYSLFGDLLINSNWIPFGENEFRKPNEMKFTNLPNSFKQDDELANLLGISNDEFEKLLKTRGHSIEEFKQFEELAQHPDVMQEAMERIRMKKQSLNFPEKSVDNVDRRSSRLSLRIDNADEKEYVKRTRSVRTSKISIDQREWLKNQYTDEYSIMYCQICKQEMPFKKRNGEYYFEAVEIFDNEILEKEIEQQFLALCPVCAAKYKEFAKSEKHAMENLINQILDENAEDPMEFLLDFGGTQESIRFVETHIFDLRQILRK